MIELPHRFVPTTSKFVNPVRIVAQTGHHGRIAALAYSPCHRYIAASDDDKVVKIWCLDTLDVVGAFRIGFVANALTWNGIRSLNCTDGTNEHVIEFVDEQDENDTAPAQNTFLGGYIPLIGAPEFSFNDKSVTLTRGDDQFEHDFEQAKKVEMEACERYVVAMNKTRVEIYDTSSENVKASLPLEADDEWVDFYLPKFGDFAALASQKTLWIFDPVREEPTCIAKHNARVTAFTHDSDASIALGDENGNITIYDAKQRVQRLRTPRFARSFAAIFPSPEKTGFIALRDESVTAFMGASQEILSSSPLPAPYAAACAGACYTEIIVACKDSAIYRLKLDTNDITRICLADQPVRCLAAAGECLVLHTDDDQFRFYDSSTLRKITPSVKTPKAIALNETATLAAFLDDEHLTLWNVRTDTLAKQFDLKNGDVIAFGKDKSADSVYVITHDRQVLLANIDSLNDLSVFEDPALANARVISVAPAAKSFLYTLCEIDHGQYAIVRVGLNSGKSSIVLRVFVVGTQIWGAAFNDQSVQLRDDANCLRIVQGLNTFSVEDWSRSEPLAIF